MRRFDIIIYDLILAIRWRWLSFNFICNQIVQQSCEWREICDTTSHMYVVPTWEMFREFMALDLNILVCYHQSELVILGKPLVDPGECLICLTNEQVRCNECFNGKNRYTGVCWFVSTDSVGHATLMNQFRTLPMPKLFAGLVTFCDWRLW